MANSGPDFVGVRDGSDAKIHTDSRIIGSVDGHVQRVDEIGASAFDTGQVLSISAVGQEIAGVRDSRKSITLINVSETDVFVGPVGVTASTGIRIEPSSAINISTTAAVHGITAAGNADVQYVEEYDI